MKQGTPTTAAHKPQ